jgi:hypothetical protein
VYTSINRIPADGFGNRRCCRCLSCRIYTGSNPSSLLNIHSSSLSPLSAAAPSLLPPPLLPPPISRRHGKAQAQWPSEPARRHGGPVCRHVGVAAPASWPTGPCEDGAAAQCKCGGASSTASRLRPGEARAPMASRCRH